MKGIFNTLFILSITLFVFSCRTPIENDKIKNENISIFEPVDVKINYLGVVWGNEMGENIQYAENELVGGG